MSQFYDQASLVMVPSGYKNGKVYSQKPLSTSGELSFTRASSATRVNSSGLVEKVRTNLVTYSNDFTNAAWVKFYSSVTAGQADPFGGTNATRFVTNGIGGYMYQNGVCVTGAEMTASVWVKSNTGSSQNFVFTANGGSSSSSSITATTSWQRVSWTFNSSSNGDILFGYQNVSLVDLLIYGFQLETGVMTDYIATTSAAVSVGPVSGLPRLDYSGGATCPSLLLEPQRTNLLLQSSVLDSGTWTKEGGSVSANSTTSPDGTANADLFTEDTSTGNHRVYQNPISTSANQPVTFSVFAKYNGRQYIYLRTDDTGNLKTAVFDIQNGTAGTVTSGATSNIENYGGGWYRCTITVAATANALTCEGLLGFLNGPSFSNASYTGNGTAGAYLWGFQGEANAAYATSYIPTLSTAVTRVADAAYKTGISSLIGQTEGTIYAEFTIPESQSASFFSISDGTSANRIIFGYYNGSLRYYVDSATGSFSSNGVIDASPVVGQTYKIAIAYKANDFKIYKNGSNTNTETTFTVPASLTALDNQGGGVGQYIFAGVKQLLLFKTRLSNADLATLTA